MSEPGNIELQNMNAPDSKLPTRKQVRANLWLHCKEGRMKEVQLLLNLKLTKDDLNSWNGSRICNRDLHSDLGKADI